MGFAPFEEKTGLNNLCNTFGFTKNKREQNHIFKMTTTENRSFKKSEKSNLLSSLFTKRAIERFALFWQKSSNWHEKLQSEFSTLVPINDSVDYGVSKKTFK